VGHVHLCLIVYKMLQPFNLFYLVMFQIHFGESSMQRCEIMLNDLIDSKRTNHNIKATIKSAQTGNHTKLEDFNCTR
jgi:hypothetical protein